MFRLMEYVYTSGYLHIVYTVLSVSGRQAYVVLHDGCVYYFKDEKAGKTAGKFSLYGYNA